MKTQAALARSSEEVSRALDQFLRERQDAADAQDRAVRLYEAEMLVNHFLFFLLLILPLFLLLKHISAEGDEEERVAMYVGSYFTCRD
jgi:hypothetical protein